jgi:hypothetical protein
MAGRPYCPPVLTVASPRVDVRSCRGLLELRQSSICRVAPAANCVEPRRRYGEVGLCASGSVPRRMAKDSTVVTTLA